MSTVTEMPFEDDVLETVENDTTMPIDISYREDRAGKSAYYDHFSLQLSTGQSTRAVAVVNNGSTLLSTIKQTPYNLPQSPPDAATA